MYDADRPIQSSNQDRLSRSLFAKYLARCKKKFTDLLAPLPQIKRLRIHTRLPIVVPERITAELMDWLSHLPYQTIVVVHVNHAQEIDAEVSDRLQRLKKSVTALLNQTVLLKGINDDIQHLVNLSEQLMSAGVLPYYLHVLDRVSGTAHFEVSIDRAKALHEAMRARLPGYLVPKLVQEQPGETSKSTLSE